MTWEFWTTIAVSIVFPTVGVYVSFRLTQQRVETLERDHITLAAKVDGNHDGVTQKLDEVKAAITSMAVDIAYMRGQSEKRGH